MRGYGGPEVLDVIELEDPRPSSGETLVRVRAVGVNPADGKWRRGMFESFAKLAFPHVPGYDVAGTVVSGGRLAPGTAVLAMLDAYRQGAYAADAIRVNSVLPGLTATPAIVRMASAARSRSGWRARVPPWSSRRATETGWPKRSTRSAPPGVPRGRSPSIWAT